MRVLAALVMLVLVRDKKAMMRKLGAMLACAFLLLPVGAAFAQGSGGGKATGSVTSALPFSIDPYTFDFAAHEGKNGQAKGEWSFNSGEFTGDVTCYDQDGSEARFSGPFEGYPWNWVNVAVEDNGEGQASDPDRIRVGFWLNTGPPDCTQPYTSQLYDVLDGNLQVYQPKD